MGPQLVRTIGHDETNPVTLTLISTFWMDLYTAANHWQVAEAFSGLAAGNHNIVLTVLGTKNASSTGVQVVVDSFVVHS